MEKEVQECLEKDDEKTILKEEDIFVFLFNHIQNTKKEDIDFFLIGNLLRFHRNKAVIIVANSLIIEWVPDDGNLELYNIHNDQN